jgi:hypothetical protein
MVPMPPQVVFPYAGIPRRTDGLLVVMLRRPVRAPGSTVARTAKCEPLAVHDRKRADTVGFTDQQAPEAAWRSTEARSMVEGTAELPGQSGRQA